MRKNRLNQVIQDNSVFLNGVITQANGDGTYSVSVKGRGYAFNNVIESQGNRFKVGDCVMLSRVEGDSQKPHICGYGPYVGEAGVREVER